MHRKPPTSFLQSDPGAPADAPGGEETALAVPTEAVIRTGQRALVMVAGIVGVQFREQIVKIEPATASLYERLGYGEINSRGLDFEGVTYAREIDNGVTVLAIRGQIVNVSDRELPVPPVRVTVRDADKRDLYQWTFTPETPKLTPKSRADFTTRLESPPPDAWDLEIRFAKAGE